MVERCRDVPGYDLFQYYDDDNEKHTIDSGDVNAYLKETTGEPFTAKDFRTWGGTVQAAISFHKLGAFDTEKEGDKNVVRMVETVAKRLGNTKAVCRQYYIHPYLIDAYLDGSLLPAWRRYLEQVEPNAQLAPEEHATLHLLRNRRST